MNLRNSSHPQFKLVLAVVDEKLTTLYGLKMRSSLCCKPGGTMDKIKHILYFTFILMPLFYINGLSVIIIDNLRILNCQFAVKRFKKNKKQIDKNKFEQFMKRVTK